MTGRRPGQGADDGIPLCHGCLSPIDPSTDYCATCGSAVGQHTEYVPFVNIRWAATGYARLHRLVWPASSSVGGRIIGIFVTMMLAPLLLFCLPLVWLAKRRQARQR